MVGSDSASIFVPLLFLVVIELSKLAKEINLEKAVKEDYHPFLVGFWPGLSKFLEKVPNLGRFNFIHGMNFVLLSLAAFELGQLSGAVDFVLFLVVWLMLILLPVFEVDEYDSILKTGRPWSFLVHAALGSIAVLYVILSPVLIDFLRSSGLPLLGIEPDDWAFFGYFFLALLANYQFLIQLEKELT